MSLIVTLAQNFNLVPAKSPLLTNKLDKTSDS